MFSRITQSPALVRVLPFAVFIALTAVQNSFGDEARFWIYLAKVIAASLALAVVWRHIPELRWNFSVWAVIAGVGVFALWVALDPFYAHLSDLYPRFICPVLQKFGLASSCAPAPPPKAWNPQAAFGLGSSLPVFFIVLRIFSATLLVPIIEEVFWRSFLYRYIGAREFEQARLGKFFPLSFVLTSVFFGFEHHEWLAGILCGFVYQGLVVWKNRLGDALVAHAITNFLLGLWVVWEGAWNFW
jgi:uncharacterized protein